MILIDRLPDDVLLEMFHFYVDIFRSVEAWQRLVHVCRRWRSVIFGSPRRLKLQLFCTANTRTRDKLDIWPALPLVIQDFHCRTRRIDNIIALLQCSDLAHRIGRIGLRNVSSWHLKDVWKAMQVPFPELTRLILHLYDVTEPVLPLPDSLLGGSAPRLRSLHLEGIPYPGLPKLLLSATHLTRLDLYGIPHAGYISPEAMVACLVTLTSLERLTLKFQSPRRESGRPPLPTRIVLPVLRYFAFKGVAEYLELLVARIDTPRLSRFDIAFFNDVVFNTPQFTRFISHTAMSEAFNVANVTLWDATASITLSSAYPKLYPSLNVGISCRELDWQLSFLEQVCSSSLPPLSTLQDLYMSGRPWPEDWKDNIDYAQWLDLLHSFSAVKNLYLSRELAPCVVPALQDLVGSRTTEVFPNLQNIFCGGSSHRDLSRKALGSLLPRGRSPVTQ